MLLLIDENVPRRVGEFLRERGHIVRQLSEELNLGADDLAIAAVADEMSAIVVTLDKDFKRIVARVPFGSRRRFRQLGRISFDCRPERVLQRLEARIGSVEFEYEQALGRRDRRLIVEITETTFRAIG